MEGRQRRSLTDDYKRQAVDLVTSSWRSIGSVAKELGLRESVLRRWVEQRGVRLQPTAAARRPTTRATLPSADHAAEIARLQRENERLRIMPGARARGADDLLPIVTSSTTSGGSTATPAGVMAARVSMPS
ncbi:MULTISPECIES: transposase [Bradyrhizobium]|uniref:Transposase n=2 Tax=Bradyrhizobium TaxID=374 RepID=A0AAE6CD05_9BRAD|nr:hypothetical protein X265_37115 [Bradyrhizobium guangdongense]QAU51234.1 hypothetical protein XH91_36325 [Bradyrhizobium guangzhouense]QOZ49877.1 hypothetical protein XH89_39935 [Bradyrhizobium sp. CCBAU 53340]QOZ57242.1 hypothetical protein XH90_35725 [Bradyrhizobium sp. CCBAU 53338]QOZ81569.1 hypothetical protein XH83_38865 [Bradyrhizobium sp. CCBAU 53351]